MPCYFHFANEESEGQKVKYFATSHTANKWWSQISNPRSLIQLLHYKQNRESKKADLEKITSNRDITTVFQATPHLRHYYTEFWSAMRDKYTRVQNLNILLLSCVKLVNSSKLSLSCFCICKMEIKTKPQQLMSKWDNTWMSYLLWAKHDRIKLISF